MSNFEDFKVGDKVAHLMLGDGKVIVADAEQVRVRYVQTRRVIGGARKHFEGVYDKRWFALNPTYLFHRSRKMERDEQASTKDSNPKTG